MGLLDMIQQDPEKREALRQGLLAAGATMLSGGRQDVGTSLGQGLGAGVSQYGNQLAIARQEAEKQRQRQAMQAATESAMIPARPAVQARPAMAAQSIYKPAPSNDPLMHEMTGQENPLMTYMDYSPEMVQEQTAATPEVQAQAEQPGGFDAERYYTAVLSNPDNPERDAALKYFASKKPNELETVVVGRTLKNKRTGETIGYDETWKEERDATREQRIAELNMRLDDQRLNREQQMELRRELAGQQAALRRDLADQSSADRRFAREQSAAKPMTAAQEAKYRDSLATDYQAANTNISNMNDVLKSIDAVREAPGLDRATGINAYIPSIPGGNAAAAEVKLKNLEGKITQLGKAAAAQGGAVGPMAVQEWKIVRDMIAAVDPGKGKNAMLEQIDLIENSVRGASARLKDAYEKQYGADFERYPQFAELNDPADRDNGQKKPAAKPKQAATFDLPPNAKQYEGKTLRDTRSGKRFKSVNGKWQEVK